MIVKSNNDGITIKMTFEDYAIFVGFTCIDEMMDYMNIYNEQEVVAKDIKNRCEWPIQINAK